MSRLILILTLILVCVEADAQTMLRRAGRVAPAGEEASSATVDTTNWYFSQTGNDDSSGNSTTAAWASPSKLTTVTLEPGDSVLVKCGDTLRGTFTIGQSGSVAAPIVVTKYGEGAAPIISGARLLTNWVERGDYYACKADTAIDNLFVDGVQQLMARMPNYAVGTEMEGLYDVDATDGSTTADANELTQADNFWNGAGFHHRVRQYRYSTGPVTDFVAADDRLTIDVFEDNGITVGGAEPHGFYLTADAMTSANALTILDTLNEWWYDSATDSVYLYAASDPNAMIVEGICLDYGVSSAKSMIVVDGLHFKHQSIAGAYFSGTDSLIRVKNSTISQGSRGVYIAGTSIKDTISGNTLEDLNHNALDLFYTSYSLVSDNSFDRIGMHPATWQNSKAISFWTSSYNSILRNTIDSVSYGGIYMGNYDTVANNVISWSVLRYSDCGAIYLSYKHHVIVRHNIISDVVGSHFGDPADTWHTATGIYLDQAPAGESLTANDLVDSNTIIRANRGIYVNYGDTACTVTDNNLWDCGTGTDGTAINMTIDTTRAAFNSHTVKRNYVYNPTDSRNIVWQWQTRNSDVYQDCGYLDSNYYDDVNGGLKFYIWLGDRAEANQSFADWKSKMTYDDATLQLWAGFEYGTDSVAILTNPTASDSAFTLTGTWKDWLGNAVESPRTVKPYSSEIVTKDN